MSEIILEINSIPEIKIEEPEDYHGQIYIITSKTSGKSYVGQCLSHALRYKVYKEHGYLGRWKQHIQEAYGSKKDRCTALNNAIVLHKPEDFEVKLITICDPDPEEISNLERYYIKEYNTISPNGYNIYQGGFYTKTTDVQRKNHSDKLKDHYADQDNLRRFADIIIEKKDAKKVQKYESEIKNIDFCFAKFTNWKDRQSVRLIVYFNDGRKNEKIEFRKSTAGEISEIFSRAATFIIQTLKNVRIDFENDEFYTYFQNNYAKHLNCGADLKL
jgi:hypothetical protein